jgi:hypothetical protein
MATSSYWQKRSEHKHWAGAFTRIFQGFNIFIGFQGVQDTRAVDSSRILIAHFSTWSSMSRLLGSKSQTESSTLLLSHLFGMEKRLSIETKSSSISASAWSTPFQLI